jgi:hypothetical protein
MLALASTVGDQMVYPMWMAIGVWFVVPVWLVLDWSKPLATVLQATVLIAYAAACISLWFRARRLRLWLPCGYPLLVLVTNVVPAAGDLIGYFRHSV